MNKMKVLLVSFNGLGKSGVPNVIFQVVSTLKDYASFDIVVFNDDSYYYKKMTEYGVHIIKIDIKEPKHRFKKMIWRLFREEKDTKKEFKRLFVSKDYDYIHSFREYSSAYIFQLADKYGIKERIIHCNGETRKPHNIIRSCIYKKKRELIYKYTTKLIGVSNDCCRISYPNMKYDVLFNSYDEGTFNYNVGNMLANNELVLTQVATYSSRKNQLFLIDVIHTILTTYPNSKLNLVGTEVEPGYLNKVKEKVKALGIEKSVNFIDGSKNFKNVFNYTTFFMLPSITEGAPISLVEAQACGITCFASDLITKDVDCGGVIYCPLDKNKWSNAIITKYKEINNKRIQYDVNKFSKETFKNNLLKIYKLL